VQGKGNKERIVAISDMTAAHLREYIEVYHPDLINNQKLLFYTNIKGQIGKMSEGNVERFIKQYANHARLVCSDVPENVYPHMFRNLSLNKIQTFRVKVSNQGSFGSRKFGFLSV
jgi:site-specific recombinase XerD